MRPLSWDGSEGAQGAAAGPRIRLWRLVGGRCEVCRQWSADALCGDCLSLHLRRTPRCVTCAAPWPTASRCGACLQRPPPFERTVAALDYAFPWDRLVADFKFAGRCELASMLADRLIEAVSAQPDPAPVDLVLPVPLSPQRLSERGYNQSALLAQRVASALRMPWQSDLLQRPIDTRHQADLPRRERETNLRGAFMVDPRRRSVLAGRHVALVDDVMTTGATLREAAAPLRRAGAASVQAWVLARTA